MPRKCYICNHYDSKTMSLYRIPNRNDEYNERSSLWLKLINEKSENIHKIRICSEHFFKKKPAKASDFLDIDWIPNQNLGRFSGNKKVIEDHFRKFQKAQKDQKSHEATCINQIVSVNETATSATAEVIQEPTNVTNRTQNNLIDNAVGGEVSSTVSILSLTDLFPLKKRKIQVIEQRDLFLKDVQTDLTASDIEYLFQYYKESIEERNQMMLKISTLVIDYEYFKANDKKTLFYTGLPTWTLFNNFHELVKQFLPNHYNCKLSSFQMLALTLMKLRLNLKFADLGYRFQVDETTASRYFHRCIYVLEKLFYKSKLIHWPERSNLLKNIPSYFQSTFKRSVTIIVDCFELFIERSGMLKASAQSFSNYKHHTTLKYLIGISITGAIIFISSGFGGRASDKFVVNRSGFLDHLREGDWVLSDKGFLVEEEVEEKEAVLILPSFRKEGKQLHPIDIENSRYIASIRIHVERVISELRGKYNICSDIVQMSAVSKQNALFNNDLFDKIVFICCCLINICPSVVKNEFEM